MKTIMSALLGMSLVAALAIPINAQAFERQGHYKKKQKKHHRYVSPRSDESRNRSDYYEHLADKLPVGSSRWFEQMEREGRFGRREN